MASHRFVALKEGGEKVYLYKDKSRSKKVRQVLWGDWLSCRDAGDGWLAVRWHAKTGPVEYFIPEADTQEDRPLEIIFLDVGQGDCAILISPQRNHDERIVIIDAGIGEELDRFLAGRFRYRTSGIPIHAAVVTHPDKDHYAGFERVFANPNLKLKNIFHNGIAERPGSGFSRLGRIEKDPDTGVSYLVDLLEDDAALRAFYGDGAAFGKMDYPRLMRTAIGHGSSPQFAMLSTAHASEEEGDDKVWMPGFAPGDRLGFTVEVLGPVVEPDAGGKARLRRFAGGPGVTKNGHSVLLRLCVGGFTLLFGGDLNRAAEEFLLQRYSGFDEWPRSTSARRVMVESATTRLASDVVKVCHHGSADVTDEFIQAVRPAAFIISSGDNETHVHPRPDLLGRLGKNGRGFAPLILSTELQRSVRDKQDQSLKERIAREAKKLAFPSGDRLASEAARQKALEVIDAAAASLSRSNVAVYGSIYVKTDGERLITAFRIEAASELKRWFYYEYRLTPNGTLIPVHEVAPG